MLSISQALACHAVAAPDAVALRDSNGSTNYSQLWEEIGYAAHLIERHCPGNGPVAICLENSTAWVALDLALMQLGRACVPLPIFFTRQQQEHALRQSGASYLIQACPPGRGEPLAGAVLEFRLCEVSPVALPSGTAKVTFTSGSTGTPKGVCLSRAMLEETAAAIVTMVGRDHGALHCALLPLAVLLENVAGLYAVLMAGGTYLVPSSTVLGLVNPFVPDFARLAASLHEMQATSIITVPELLRGLVGSLTMTRQSIPSLTFVAVGGARVSPRLLAQAECVGLPVHEGYGLSEAGSVISLNVTRAKRAGTAGRLLPHVRARVAEDGELLVEHPVFLGYAGEQMTPQVLATGDIASQSEDGFLSIGGRKSALIITGFGRNVSPEWLESELLSQPVIAQAFVFDESESVLSALVVPVSGKVTKRQVEAAIAAANANLPPYATISSWRIVPPFTSQNGLLTANGRLCRAAIVATHIRAGVPDLTFQTEFSMTFFEKLLHETARERAELIGTRQIQDGLCGRISRGTYIAYLAEAYHHVKHTVPLMEAAKAALRPDQIWMASALDEYVEEERGHEEWILGDIAAAGGDAAAVRTGAPQPATELMVSYIYDYVTRINPVGLFGMVLVLEGTSIELASKGASAIQSSLGLGDDCFHYLTSHGALDLQHMRFFETLMNKVEDKGDQAAIIHVARSMYLLFAGLFRSIPHTDLEAHAA
ncbi:MAG: AMP-binding protein [Hyphomicrobiales bacterium]